MGGNFYDKYTKVFGSICLFMVVSLYIQNRYTTGNIARLKPENQTLLALKQLKIERRASVPAKEKWIIVTSINPPTEQVKVLSQIQGWQLLVVGDKKSPKDWSYPGVIFLSEEEQESLGYEVLKLLPWNSYTRKVVGYLYAIEHQAKFIYDTDDDNAPEDLGNFEKSFVFNETMGGLILQKQDGESVANPYTHFGQTTIWPRGYPLDKIGESYNNTYTTCRLRTPPIQQGLVNGDPDVDAIFRLTRKSVRKFLNIQFDPSAPAVIFPKGLLSPFNSQNTMFHYPAFWALLLPIGVTFRVTDIWRGYWAQPLLWKMGANLAFLPPKTTQVRNAHLYLRDFGDEDQLYKQAGDLANFLSEWNCFETSFFDCMIRLSEEMAENGFWTSLDVDLVKAWVRDLKRIGYVEPNLISDGKDDNPCLPNHWKSLTIFKGVNYKTEGDLLKKSVKDERIELRKFCNFPISFGSPPNNGLTTVKKTKPYFPNILLVVTFNFPMYRNIWLLDLIYVPHFPNILYCGDLKSTEKIKTITKSAEFLATGIQDFSIIDAVMHDGFFGYECALKAIEMGYSGIDGYLVLSDDMLLNFWNIGKFDKKEVWTLTKITEFHGTNEPNVGWHYWWKGKYGVRVLRKAMEEIYMDESNAWVKEFRDFRERYGYNQTTGMFTPAASDIFYIPSSKAETFYQVGKVMRKWKVFLEIAIPVLATGLSAPDKLVDLNGTSLWRKDREKPFKFYSEGMSALHPIKFGDFRRDKDLRKQYCHQYIANVLNNS